MQNETNLQELLAETVKRLNSDQVKVFRRELEKNMLIAVKKSDRKATKATKATRRDADK